MEVLLALVGLGFLVGNGKRKRQKRRKERKEKFNKMIKDLGLKESDGKNIEKLVKNKVKLKSPQEIYNEFEEKIKAANEDYAASRIGYTRLLRERETLSQELLELKQRKARIDAIIRKNRESDQHKNIVFFYTKESMQLEKCVKEKEENIDKCETGILKHKAQSDDYFVKLNDIKIEQKAKMAEARTNELLTDAYKMIMHREKVMDEYFDLTEIMKSINESRILLESTKVTYDTDPYYQRKQMEREADRLLAEEYARNL